MSDKFKMVITRTLLLAIGVGGLVFSLLQLMASVSVIGFKIPAALKYGIAVMSFSILFEFCWRFAGDWYRKKEPWIIAGVFFVLYFVVFSLVPEMGQVKMPWDSYPAQKSLTGGHFWTWHKDDAAYWVNYGYLLSALGIVFSPKLIVGQVLNGLVRALALHPIFRMSEKVSGRFMARIVTVSAAMSPALTLYSSCLLGDFIAATCYLYVIYLVMSIPDVGRLSDGNGLKWWGVGTLLGVGCLFKPVSFLFLGAIATWMVLKVLEARRARAGLIAVLALAVVIASHHVVMSARQGMMSAMNSPAMAVSDDIKSFKFRVLFEIYSGMNIATRGIYTQSRTKTFVAAKPDDRVKMVKDMLKKDLKRYPSFMVSKFKSLWGSNDEWLGSMFYWFYMSCAPDVHKPHERNRCVKWLKPLLRAEHLFFAVFFLLGAGGFALTFKKSSHFLGIGVVSLVVSLSFVALSMIIEAHSRYKAVVYPFFFMVLPYAKLWFSSENPLYVKLREMSRWLFNAIRKRRGVE